MSSTPRTPAASGTSLRQASSPFEESVKHLNEEASHWKDTVTEKKAVALGLHNSIQAYQNYLAELNSKLEQQLHQYQGQLEGDDSDYGVLERLRSEFNDTLAKERQLAAQMQSRFQDKIALMQRSHADAVADTEQRLRRLESERAQIDARHQRELQAARRREEAAKDGEAAANMARDDAQALYADLQRQQKSLSLANGRLKEKLRSVQEAHERELEHKASTMERWQRDLEEASESRAAALRRAETAETQLASLEARLGDLEQSNRSLDVSLSEARSGKEEFIYSVQMANERLKEKLRLTLEDRAAIAAELKQYESLQSVLEKSRVQADQMNRRLRSLEAELERAARYKEDWMTEVKKRVALEEEGHTEAVALRAQLDQLRGQLSELNNSNVSLHENQIRLANAESRVRELEQEHQHHEEAMGQLEHRNGSLETELNQARRETSRLTSELSQMSDQLKTARSQLVTLSNVGSELSKAENRLSKLEEQLQAEQAKSRLFENANMQLEKELSLYKASSQDGLQERVQELLNASGSMAQQLSSASSNQEALALQLHEARERLAEMKREVASAEQEARETAETAKAWKVRYEKAKAAAEQADDDLRAVVATQAEDSAQKQATQTRLLAVEREREEQAEKLRQNEARLAQIAAQLELATQKGEQSEARLADLTRQFAKTGADKSFDAWCAALEAAKSGNSDQVRRFLDSPEQGGNLDNLIRAVLQKSLLAAPAPDAASPLARVQGAAGSDSPQVMANNFKSMLEDRAGVIFNVFKVLQASPQVHPYGRTLFLKVDVGDGEALWIRLFETNGAPAICNSAQGPKDIREEMIYFDEWDLHFVEQPSGFDLGEEEENEEEEDDEEEDEGELVEGADGKDAEEDEELLSEEVAVDAPAAANDDNWQPPEEDIAPADTVRKSKKKRGRVSEPEEPVHVYNLRSHDELPVSSDSEKATAKKGKMASPEAADAEEHHYNLRSYDHDDDEHDDEEPDLEAQVELSAEPKPSEAEANAEEHRYNLRSYDSSAEPPAEKKRGRRGASKKQAGEKVPSSQRKTAKAKAKAASSPPKSSYGLRSAKKKRK